MKAEWVAAIIEWAAQNTHVDEVWLFGSRAKGTARPDSDVDLCLRLRPGGSALGAYFALGDRWQQELGQVLGRHVSLEAMEPGSPEEAEVHSTGRQLFARR